MIAATRVAYLIALVCFGAALWLSYTQVDGETTTDCGQWWHPAVTADDVTQMRATVGDRANTPAGRKAIGGMQALKTECDSARASRRNVVIGLGAAGVVIPGALLFIVSGSQLDRLRRG